MICYFIVKYLDILHPSSIYQISFENILSKIMKYLLNLSDNIEHNLKEKTVAL